MGDTTTLQFGICVLGAAPFCRNIMVTMAEDSTVQETILKARSAQVIGNYNQATIILTDLLKEQPRVWEVRLALTLNYLRQGYLNQAIAVLDPIIKGTAPFPDGNRDADLAGFLATYLKVRHTGKFPEIWESSCRTIWECHLRRLKPDEYTEAEVRSFFLPDVKVG